MILHQHIKNYIDNPFPQWNNELTMLLVDNKSRELQSIFPLNEIYNYSIVNSVTKTLNNIEETIPLSDSNIIIAIPTKTLESFYKEHGLVTVDVEEKQDRVTNKIKNALSILRYVPNAYLFINHIVKSIQIIKSEYSDTDISYSHPEIPFSIFFSLCEEVSIVSDLRVAESILHEAMHLKLTLIEVHIDLFKPNSHETFYSPWRNEERPVRGVLHGLFVFRAILDFYEILLKNSISQKANHYLSDRIFEIKSEINLIKAFPQSKGLTMAGQKLSSMLLK